MARRRALRVRRIVALGASPYLRIGPLSRNRRDWWKPTFEIVDNRQEYMNAFSMVREGMEFLKRTIPLGARFSEGQIFREDRFPIPLDALREILLNAVMHCDYSHYSGHVAIVVFDDRVEIRSYGRLPNGVTLKQLPEKHISKPTNPLIAGSFYRTGAVEVWGQGTNRVIAAYKRHEAAPPKFEELQGFLIVTFKAQMIAGGTTPQVTPQVEAVLEAASPAASAEALQRVAGLKDRVHFLKSYLQPLLEQGLLERTLPDKLRSRMQKYRTTKAGVDILGGQGHT